MTNLPVVSGIIIFLNEAPFIEAAIASVFAQTDDRWELLLMDDGSTDASSEIARRYSRDYPAKVRYLEHPDHQNRGMSASRNLGIRHARGRYIALLDADDVWLPKKLEQQIALLEQYPEAAMVYGRTQFWHSWSGDPADRQRDSWTDLGLCPNTLVRPPHLLTLFLRREETVASTCSVLIRREVFAELGSFEETFRNQFEDMVFYTKVFWQKPVYVAHDCWDRYRQHPGNSWVTPFKSGEFDLSQPNPAREQFLRWMEGYLAQRGAQGTEVWAALQTALFPYRQRSRYVRRQRLNALGWRVRERMVSWLKRNSWLAPWFERLRIQRQKRRYRVQRDWLRPEADVPTASTTIPLWGISAARFYTEQYLSGYRADIQGQVLEANEADYAAQFGGDRLTQLDRLWVTAPSPNRPPYGELTAQSFDCILFPQHLADVDDVGTVLETLHRSLKVGGVLLALWRDTDPRRSAEIDRCLANLFPSECLTAIAQPHGFTPPRDAADPADPIDPETFRFIRAVKAEVNR